MYAVCVRSSNKPIPKRSGMSRPTATSPPKYYLLFYVSASPAYEIGAVALVYANFVP